MTARRETDHAFKTRMAAEGRAIHVPGKTEEEVKAERAAREKPRPVTLHLSEDRMALRETGLSGASDLIHDAAAVLAFLSREPDLSDKVAELAPVLRLSAKALHSAERGIAALDLIAMELRTARAWPGRKGGVA
jgi:hypothetical protein